MNSNSNNIINLLCNISEKKSENKTLNEIPISKFKREFLIDYNLNQTLISQKSIEDDDFYFNKNIIMSKEEVEELRKNLLGNKTNRINNENPIISNEKNKNLVSYKNGKIKIQQEEEDKKIENNNNDIIKLNQNVTIIYLLILQILSIIKKLLINSNLKISKQFDKNEKKYWFCILKYTYIITVNKLNDKITEIKRVKENNNSYDKILKSDILISKELNIIKSFLESHYK